MSVSQAEGLQALSDLVALLGAGLQQVASGLDFAVVFWNRDQYDDPLSTMIFARAEVQPVSAFAAITVAVATTCAAYGVDVHDETAPINQALEQLRAAMKETISNARDHRH